MLVNEEGDNTCEDVIAGEKKTINPELWQACAGPLVNLPAAGTHVVYFPQGHSEQVNFTPFFLLFTILFLMFMQFFYIFAEWSM